MLQLSYAKNLECYHQLDNEEILSIALAITEEALSQSTYDVVDSKTGLTKYSGDIKKYLESKGMQFERAIITFYDVDSICLSFDPNAMAESPIDVSIRTWDIYGDWENNPDSVHVNWTFHIFGDYPDLPKTSSRVLNDIKNGNGILIDGSSDILVHGVFYGLDSIGSDDGFEKLTKDDLVRLLAAARSGRGGLRTARWYKIWFQAMCSRPDLCGIDETDDEIRILSIIKNNFQYINESYQLSEYVLNYLGDKFRQEWYKDYIGTKKITFDGPANYTETGEITDGDISAFMSGAWDNFLNHRLRVGHTERQDRFTAFMRNYPQEILDWMGKCMMPQAIPYLFYEGLAKGGEYELYGCSKDEFIDILRNKDLEEKTEEFEYAAVLEDNYGIDYAVDYLIALNWEYFFCELSDGSADFIVQMFSKAVSSGDNAEALKAMGIIALGTAGVGKDRSFIVYSPNLSIEMYSRLAVMWKQGLINDNWLTDDYGIAGIFDWVWGEYWEEEDYPDCPEEDDDRIWLLKLLESDFANDIADCLNPLLEQVLEREKNHTWENGKKAIESFLAETSNK